MFAYGTFHKVKHILMTQKYFQQIFAIAKKPT